MSEPDLTAPITEKEIQLVQESWGKCIPIAETAADLFYGKLFELDPSVKPLFKTDIKEQGKKLMTMITTAVNGLDKLDTIVGAVQAMGKRHAGYGVKDEHYDTVGSALIWTLGQGLGDAFTEEVKVAWLKTYTLLATTMKDAAAEG
ncbi:MAG: globin family protein [Opitutales bacterium]